ncbi:coiled-coil domain-containing protein 142 [Plakobranchus ocellatus]|uniref:Coiled-coil domain-containing protein 142 n=1 Tax=Plakobranchus ocellatus TaxID=259542 RepID=A0AAV4DX43_9GAST|nr:coiled-coil domain-containing protein 142 [Plakobranchus ocellatus]
MECRTVYAIRHGCAAETPVTKLYCLNALCEDLRLHVAHWNSIKQRLNTCRWLQPRLGQLCLQLQHVTQTLTSAILRAVRHLDQLIHIGFEVFAHCNVETLTPEIMWNIARGLEDFNSIVGALRLSYQMDKSQNFGSNPFSDQVTSHSLLLNSSLINPLKTIQFTKILGILANERSKYAAKLAHQFFTCNEHFLRMLSTGSLPNFEWGDYLPHQNQPHSLMMMTDTSDYHTFTGSNASLNATYLQVGFVRAPDLSNLSSPLVEFSAKEQEFAESFLLIVCNSTSLLRKNEPGKPQRAQKISTAKNFMSPVVGRPPRVQYQNDTPVMNRADSQRKKVSWGDNADNSIRSAVVAHYMDSLWLHLGRNLDLFLDEPAWQGRRCLLSSDLGSVLLFNDTVIAVLRNMVEHVCYKDMFPPTSVQPLLGVVFRLHALSAYGAWDAFASASLASETTDKCQPCLLNGDLYSTKTGRLLREMYMPLMSILQEICRCYPHDHEDTMQHADADLSVCAGITWRILTTCKLAVSWCSTKIQQFLSMWNIDQFLLLTHTDLKILVDCTKNASYLLETINLKEEQYQLRVSDNLSVCQLRLLHQQISQVNAQIQSFSGTTMKNFLDKYSEFAQKFFQENMLPARMWKRKLAPEEKAEANNYAKEALEVLLVPVVRGISKLSTTSQIGVIAMVTVAFCNTWLGLILKEKIKFSLWGAVQLGIDFDYVHTKLGELIASDEVRQSTVDLAIFQQMKGIVILLKRQPSQKQTSSRLMDNFMCDSVNTVPPPETTAVDDKISSNNLSSEGSPMAVKNGTYRASSKTDSSATEEDDETVHMVSNMQEWLALRAVGGSKSWKFPACFSRSSSDN